MGFFVDHMMQVELGMQTPAEINGIWKNALATVFSVTAFGIMPLVAYLSLYVVNPNPAFMLPLMLAATVFATCFILFTLVYTNAVLTRQPRLRSGLRMVLFLHLSLVPLSHICSSPQYRSLRRLLVCRPQ